MTIGIDATLLAHMRAQVLYLLPDTAVIQSVSNSSDGAGGFSATWAAVSGGTVVCRIDPVTSRENIDVILGRETTTVMHQLTMPHNAPLNENNRVVINGNTYEVIQFTTTHSNNVSVRAIISEVR